jgi:hypothetical protein
MEKEEALPEMEVGMLLRLKNQTLRRMIIEGVGKRGWKSLRDA